MKRIQINKFMAVLFLLVFLIFGNTISAQNKTSKKVKSVTFNSIVTSEKGNPIPNATVSGSEGSIIVKTSNNGSFTLVAKDRSQILIEANGFEDKVVLVIDGAVPDKIELKESILFSGTKNIITLPAGVQNSKRNLVGAVSFINGEVLSAYPDAMLSNMLQGKIMGLRADMNTGGLANNPSGLSIRGNHRGENNFMVTIVDGMERPIEDLLPEEIDRIEVLKDATTKILYGARAANGVLLITTKKGDKLKRIIKTSVEYGYGQVTRTPEYLNSYDYARLYNQARQRDGLSPIYSATDLEAYKNSSGPNDFRHPNVDFSNYFLKDFNNYRKVTTEFSGGNGQTQYSFVAGYTGTDGLQKIGEKPQYNRLNLRGNLDVQINDFISGFIGLAGQFDMTKRGPIDHLSTFTAIRTTRPNEYPLIIDESVKKADSLGIPALGASFPHPDNLYGTFMYGGYAKDQNINGQTNFGLKFDFSKFLNGLSAKAYYTFDNSFYGQESLNTSAATYAQRYIKNQDGTEQLILVNLKKTNVNDNVSLSNTFNRRAIGYVANVNYTNTFNQHGLNFDFSKLYLKQEITGSGQDIKTSNYVLRGNYSYQSKYFVEGDISWMGSSKFIEANRYQLFYAGGFGWIISEEKFFKTSLANKIDYLKLKASAGLLGYDASTAYRLYQNRWINDNSYEFNNSNTIGETKFDLVGNPNLKWEKSRQINIGIEALALNRRLFAEANYFNELSFDQIQKVDAIYSSMYGSMYPSINWGKVSNQGVEFEIRWNDKTSGELEYSLGGNMLYSKNKILKADEVNHPDEYLRMTNQPSDAMFGYVTEGIFGKDVQLEGHARQTFGAYGNGDIAYKDLNSDGVINTLDRKVLGNSLPRVVLGIDINLKYRGWGLYALGTADLGVSAFLNNSYFWMSGEDKYSVKALESYDAVSNPMGKFPALTTKSASNNLMNSDFWMEKSSFFRLKNVELSYTFNFKNASSVAKSVKLFTRGTNLMLISKIKDLDPEALNAGIENYPVLRNITAGISVLF